MPITTSTPRNIPPQKTSRGCTVCRRLGCRRSRALSYLAISTPGQIAAILPLILLLGVRGWGALGTGYWALEILDARILDARILDARIGDWGLIVLQGCPMPYALCPMRYAPCAMPHALCPMPDALLDLSARQNGALGLAELADLPIPGRRCRCDPTAGDTCWWR